MLSLVTITIVIVGTITVVSIGLLYPAMQSTGPSEESSEEPSGNLSPVIPGVPLATYPMLINDIPPESVTPETRCHWFVLCGRYVILETDGYFFFGSESVELEQAGHATMYGLGSGCQRDVVPCCSNQMGRWSAERIALDNDDAGRHIHRVTISACSGTLFPSNDVEYHRFKGLNCTLERGSEGLIGLDRLICDDGSIWVHRSDL